MAQPTTPISTKSVNQRARFDGKVAVVTGGSSGIGLGIVRGLISEGAKVAIGDFNPTTLEAAVKEFGSSVKVLLTDVRSETDIINLMELATSMGPLDVAFNAAGIGEGALIHEQELAQWNKVLDICLTGVFLSVKHEARAMLTLGGSIVNIASINSVVPAYGASAYSVAKAGVQMLTKNAALDLGELGVRVNAVAPGLVNTPMSVRTGHGTTKVINKWLEHTPLGRIGQPEDIASAALFLASDEASWISGETLFVDGGQTLTAYPDLREVMKPE